MSLISKEISDFSVKAYQNGEFRTVTKADVLGQGDAVLLRELRVDGGRRTAKAATIS